MAALQYMATRIQARAVDAAPHRGAPKSKRIFGELSNSCYSLCTAIVRVNTARILSFWEIPPKHALALCKQKILRIWGLTAQRGWARLILDRIHDLVLSPGNPSIVAHEPDSVSHEHRTSFFPDCGHSTAN